MAASSKNKRKRRERRNEADADPEFQVAPMVDVLLVLMLFFMSITSTELLKKEKNLHLAEAKQAKEDADKKNKEHEVVVNVSWEPKDSTAGFSLDGVHYPTADALQGVLAARMAHDPRTYVLIRADKDVQYSNISDLMTTCSNAGIGTVTFAVIIGGDKGPAKTASN
jgi:biopolymer transport protein ExbD